jgi:iron transport multicopper oxidase
MDTRYVLNSSQPGYQIYTNSSQYVMTVSDWYHQQAANLVHIYQNQPKGLRKGVEPTPDSSLINDSTNVKFNMVPGKRYLFRIINMSGFASMIIKFGGHDMTIVETDGVATEFTPASQIQIATAQRYAVIIQARPDATENFAIMSAMMPSMFAGDVMPVNMNVGCPSPILGT